MKRNPCGRAGWTTVHLVQGPVVVAVSIAVERPDEVSVGLTAHSLGPTGSKPK
jgi:hypothetical protein